MNYYKNIKEAFQNEEKRRGLRAQIRVNSKDLYFLLEDYERLDAFVRVVNEDKFVSLERRLFNVLHAMYFEYKSSEKLMLFIMNTLRPLIEERLIRIDTENIYGKQES